MVYIPKSKPIHLCMIASMKWEPVFVSKRFSYWKEATTAFKKRQVFDWSRDSILKRKLGAGTITIKHQHYEVRVTLGLQYRAGAMKFWLVRLNILYERL